MSNTSTSSGGGGIGFAGLLAIVFITLKLTHVIDWSWWWVLAPLWAGLALLAVIFFGVLAVTFIVGVIVGFVKVIVNYVRK